MSDDYKKSKEAFVSDQSGSSLTHINLISSVALSSIALYSALRSRLSPTKELNLLTEYLLLVLPLLLSMTLFAHKPLALDALLLLPTFFVVLFIPRPHQSLPSSRSPSRPPSPIEPKSETNEETNNRIVITPIPALTTFRTHMLLMTILAILAVDFPVFPRDLAKCETFGVSLMDLGVGSFVFSQGVVSAIPLLKNPSQLSAPLIPKVKMASRKVLPLIFLGLIRVLLVKGTEYPEHVSEYGTHWNFFLTLALLPPLRALLHPLLLHSSMLGIGLGITLIHQFLLSNTSLQAWTLHAPRTNLLTQNKEGLVSLPGYLAIHMLGVLTGTIVLPPSPSDFRRIIKGTNKTTLIAHKSRSRQDVKTAIELCSYAVVWWCLLGVGNLLDLGGGVSRRLANSRYVLWVVAFNTLFITAYLVLDIFFFPPPPERRAKLAQSGGLSPTSPVSALELPAIPPRKASVLLEAFNLNGLSLFLLANVGTGLINLTVKTMYASDLKAMVMLSLYAFILSAVAWVTKDRRLWKM